MRKETKLNYDYIRQATEIPRLFMISFLKHQKSEDFYGLKISKEIFKNKEIKNPKKILIINTCLIGDIIASLPALSQYIHNNKSAEIDIIVPPPTKSIIEKLKGVNKVYLSRSVSNRKIEKLKISDAQLEELMKNSYDLVIVMRISKDAYDLLKKLKSSAVRVSFLSYIGYIFHLAKNIISKGKVKQYSEINFDLIGEKVRDKKFEEIFNFSKKDYKKIEKMPIMLGKEKKIIIHAGSGWRRQWENKKWMELLKKINKIGNFKFIFVGGDKTEEKDFKIIKDNLNFRIYSIIRKVNLSELLLIMRRSDYFIGVDSGPRNIAHLANLRSVSLLGPGPKHFMPVNKKDVVVDKSNCRCTHLFCFKKETCMQKITVDEVFEGFKKLINNKHKK